MKPIDTRQIFFRISFCYERGSPDRKFQFVQNPNQALQTESSKFFKTPIKNNSGADVGPRPASEKLRGMFSSKRIDAESSTDIDRQNQQLLYES